MATKVMQSRCVELGEEVKVKDGGKGGSGVGEVGGERGRGGELRI
jgi:hypothetical protein